MAKIFKGLFTALVTPFTEKNKIDYSSLETLLAEQLTARVDGLVILGTTGEGPVISVNERKELTKFIINSVKGKTKVILGTGSNNTQDSIEKSQQAEKMGVDGLLVVNPYYNKPTQDGLFQHFSTIAKSVTTPVILYNIQGRTAVNLETETLLKLAEIENIVAVKEASGNINQMMSVIKRTPTDFSVLSGDDSLAYPLITLGGDGVVSVISNLIPQKMVQLVKLGLNSDFKEALTLHYEIYDLMRGVLSIGCNPIAIKTLLAWQGKIKETFRLPLCPLNTNQKEQLKALYHG